MLSNALHFPLVLWLSWALAPVVAFAQVGMGALSDSTQRGIAGTGTVAVKEQPTYIRMSIELSEKAETLKEALSRMQDRREAAVMQLEALGAKTESIVVHPPTLATGKTNQQRRMEQMLRMRQMQGRRVPRGLQAPKVVTVTSTLTADWPLNFKTQEELLAFVSDLENQVTEADLAGMKDQKELSPEAEELDEEMQMMMMDMSYGEEEINPGEPRFFYVATLTEAARDKAMAEAFEMARAHAAQLAQAAGIELGDLASLRGYVSQVDQDRPGYYYDGGAARAWMMLARQAYQTEMGDSGTVAIVATPTPATFQVAVMANFAMPQ